jgi:hypothetical protein
MPSRSLLRPTLAGAVLALVSTAVVAADASTPVAVPPVAEIPVAPIPAAKKKAAVTAEGKPPTTVVTTTTTTTVPALAAVAVEPPAPAALRPGATELMPALPAPASAASPPHVVLVDELPFRVSHTRAREQPEHAHHGHKKGRHGRPFHPAPGIVVDVNDAAGGASADDLQRDARNVGYWPFRHCYEEGLRRDQHIGGKVSLDVAVGPGGAMQSANITGASLHDESVVLCVAREAAHLSLGGGEAAGTAKLGITLSTGDEPVPVPHAVVHADDLREALHASWPAVKQCYAGALAKHPDAGGRMELRFHVKPGGEIAEVAENDTRFGDVEVTRCVLGVYRTAKLSSVGHGSHDTSFVYALHFESRPEAPASLAAK